MAVVDNSNVDKIYLLPDDVMVLVPIAWCNSVISKLKSMELDEDLIKVIDGYISLKIDRYDSPYLVPKYASIPVYVVRQILGICGRDTFTFIPPHCYEQLSSDYLTEKLGDVKTLIELAIELDDHDKIIDVIAGIEDNFLKHIALVYMKILYNRKTELEVKAIYDARRLALLRIMESSKGTQTNCS